VIHHLVLFKLKPSVDEERIEWMMRETRIQLLKIPEVLSVRCGKRVDPDSDWPFFLAVEIESLDKLALYAADPHHVKFVEEVIKPNTIARMALDYETAPGRDVRYS
jgi:hypothetical protein